MESLLNEKREAGLTTGFMFRMLGGKVTKASYFEEQLITRLEWIQQNTEGIILASINLWEEFGVHRSDRRGATTEALHTGIDGAAIGANNGRRKVEADKGKVPRYDAAALHTVGAGSNSLTQVVAKGGLECSMFTYGHSFDSTVLKHWDRKTSR
jgi:hypothetical protein